MPGRDAVYGVPSGITGTTEEETVMELAQGWAI